MKCSVNGCRICPGMWVAAALLLFSLVRGLFVQPASPPPAAAGEVVSAQPAAPATDPGAVPPPGADAP